MPGKAFAIIQQPEDKNSATVNSDLGEVNDDFQEYFFEALKQRGIENYEKANEVLQKCLAINDQSPVIHYEIAKNYYSCLLYTSPSPRD